MSNSTVLSKYLSLPQHGKVNATYVWIDGSLENVRGKTMTYEHKITSVDQLKWWNFDGSSTGQAPGNDSDVLLKPVSIFKDPFLGGDNILVMCETYENDGVTPHSTNNRAKAVKIFENPKVKEAEAWFGIEQEYTLLDTDETPYGWPKMGFPGPQGPYYCGAGADKVYGRDIVEAHYRACQYAGVSICGTNAEVMPAQWEFQVGVCKDIEMGDHLWMARYILCRLGEEFNVVITFDPKPIPGDWNGAGCHTNYSTKQMREEGGIEAIKEACAKMEPKHLEHIKIYGKGNERRLTGAHETAPIDKFSWGVANRGCSIRIPRSVAAEKKGYLEDRRPASNIDPYLVTAKIAESTLL